MKKDVIILVVLCIAVAMQSNAQEQKQKNDPDEQVFVNKKYDENGNLIQYDSTYVHQWSSDSTMNFSFGNGFPNRIDQSTIDSMLQQFGISGSFGFSPFDDEDFFNQFDEMFPGSIFMEQFSNQNDSMLQNFMGPHTQIQNFFNSPGFDEWQKQMQQQMERLNGAMIPDFQNEEQRKEWENLRKKQQEEMQELMKKWEDQ